MKILVTGAKGFIGKNLIAELRNRGYQFIYEYDIDSDSTALDRYTEDCEFVFHLAGINRPRKEEEFMKGNCEFVSILLNKLKEHRNRAPILITSSVQAELDNPYGRSKKAGEEIIFTYAAETESKVMVYRLPNVFGKWCNPDYNSAVATFCYNIANGLEIRIDDPDKIINLVYIDDVLEEFMHALEGREYRNEQYCSVPVMYTKTLGTIVVLLYSYKESREKCAIPNMADDFSRKLYSTYLSYLPKDQFSYFLNMNMDERGSFTEFIKTLDRGQVSVNIIKPGITKGNHWHHTKSEKFLVVYGSGYIRFRKYGSEEVIQYAVSGDKLEVVDIPPGYSHSITNMSDTDMVTIMWANEVFDKDKPDTSFMKVLDLQEKEQG